MRDLIQTRNRYRNSKPICSGNKFIAFVPYSNHFNIQLIFKHAFFKISTRFAQQV
jgi:hypothetical protein